MRKSIKKVLSLTLAAAMTITLGSGLGATKEAATVKAADAATFKAYVGFQTNNWAFRNSCEGDLQSGSGAISATTIDTGKDKTVPYNYESMLAWNNGDYGRTFNITNTSDVISKNDTEYSAKIEGLDSAECGGDFFTTTKKGFDSSDPYQFTMMCLATNIPVSDKNVKFTNLKLYYDGELIVTQPTAFVKNDSKSYYQLMFINKYGIKKKGDLPDPAIDATKFPKKSIEIKYTVSGLDFAAAAATPSTIGLKLNGKASNVKKLVTAGKSTTVTAARTVSPAAALASTHEAIAYTAVSGDEKIAKVASISTPDDNGEVKVKISVPKTATKGKSTYVTIKSGDMKRKVKVVVKNPVKKITAAKKKVTVKKGKKVKTTFKITNTNKKYLTTDSVSVSFKKKYAKKVSVKITKTKVYVTIKGLKKKKTTTMTVKVGSKKAKMTIKTK